MDTNNPQTPCLAPYSTIAEATAQAGLSSRTVERYIAAGILPTTWIIGRRLIANEDVALLECIRVERHGR